MIPKRGRGRPPKEIDAEQLEKLAAIWATDKEIADFFGVAAKTIQRMKSEDGPLREAYDRGRAEGNISLRRDQRQLAKTNAGMAIWLGKQYLGQKEDPPSELPSDGFGDRESTVREVAGLLARIAKRESARRDTPEVTDRDTQLPVV